MTLPVLSVHKKRWRIKEKGQGFTVLNLKGGGGGGRKVGPAFFSSDDASLLFVVS